METPQQQQLQQQQQQAGNVDQDGGCSSNGKSSFLCRQSSTRWTPTTDQIRILKDLYYNNGIRSPTAEQIQKISAKLRQYGKIEGKNVFYWFQNHKARERQKKRFTAAASEIPNTIQQRGVWRSSDDHPPPIYNMFPNINPGITSPSTSSPGVLAVGHMGNYGYGSVAMEKSFRDCSISPCGNGDGSMGQNFAWVGMDHPYPQTYPFLDKRKAVDETLDDDQDEETPEIETLPLFPMHGEDISGFCSSNLMKRESENIYYTDWFRSAAENNMGGVATRASLELSLNSYSYCGRRSTQAP